MGARLNRGKSRQDYGTPPQLVRAVERRFGPLAVDLAASATNAKARHYFNAVENSLAMRWHMLKGNLWLNPPFANIAPWARKCMEEARLGAMVLMLVPAAVGSDWFARYVHGQASVLALQGRLTFEGASDPYPKDCILCCYGYLATGFSVWDWRADAA